MNKNRWGLAAALALLALVFLLPMVLTLISSFLSEAEIMAAYHRDPVLIKLIPDRVTLEQYGRFLTESPELLRRFWISVICVVPITFLQLATAAMAAFFFSRSTSKWSSRLFFLYVVLTLLPYQVTLVPNYLVSKWLGTYDSLWAIILPGIFSPFGVFLLSRSMRRIPKSYAEAAALDGAKPFRIFRSIYLPQCKSSLAAVGLLIFLEYWNMVEQPLVLLRDEMNYPLSIYLATINQEGMGIAFAAAVIYAIPCVLLFLGTERHIDKGIATGGMK